MGVLAMNRNPIMWAASNYSLQINRRKVTAYDRRWPRATFHETWEEAHEAQIAKAQARADKAADEAKKAARHAASTARALAKVKAMKPQEIQP